MRPSGSLTRTARLLLAALVCLPIPLAAEQPSEDAEEVAARVEALRRRAFESVLEKDLRLLRIGDRLRTSGLDLCPEQRRLVWGVVTATERELVGRRLAAWKPTRAAARDVEVLWVEPGSPADSAGIAVGDVLESLDGRRLKKSSELYRRQETEGRTSLPLSVRRGDVQRELSLPVVLGCFTAAGLALSDELAAYMTYHGVYVTSGMLRFVTSDDELAVILGHEFAHGILLTWSKPPYEADADYLGLYLAAQAGYDIEGAPGFWSRLAVRTPYGLVDSKDRRFRTHPRSTGRALSLRATISEIREKRAAGLPLEPERPE